MALEYVFDKSFIQQLILTRLHQGKSISEAVFELDEAIQFNKLPDAPDKYQNASSDTYYCTVGTKDQNTDLKRAIRDVLVAFSR